jgi:hypothetical protein
LQRLLRQYGDALLMGLLLGTAALVGLAMLDQRMISLLGWQTDMTVRTVPLSDFTQLAARDSAPPIDQPHWAHHPTLEWLTAESPVILLEVNGEARAYPLAVLLQHHIVNDSIQGIPIAVTYCALCNTALVYSRRVGDAILRFGDAGSIRHSGLIMWDDRTESWWQQFTGKAIVGEYSGTMLQILPSRIVSYALFREHYPQGNVLIGATDQPSANYAYTPLAGYDEGQPFLYQGKVDPRLPPMERVLAIVIDGEARAYPFSVLAERRLIEDTVNGIPLLALWQAGVVSVVDEWAIAASRDVGMGFLFARTVNGRTLTFWYCRPMILCDRETQSEWNLFGQAIAGELRGAQLPILEATPSFWFAWAAHYPQTQIYGK